MSVNSILEQLSFCNDENAGKDIFATIRRGIDQAHSRYNKLPDHVQISSAESGKAAAIKAQLEKCSLQVVAKSKVVYNMGKPVRTTRAFLHGIGHTRALETIQKHCPG